MSLNLKQTGKRMQPWLILWHISGKMFLNNIASSCGEPHPLHWGFWVWNSCLPSVSTNSLRPRNPSSARLLSIKETLHRPWKRALSSSHLSEAADVHRMSRFNEGGSDVYLSVWLTLKIDVTSNINMEFCVCLSLLFYFYEWFRRKDSQWFIDDEFKYVKNLR